MADGVPSWVEREFRDHASRGALCVAVFWRTDSLAPAAPVVATTSWSRSVARAAVCVPPVTLAVWLRPPPISSITSCE